MEIGNIRSELNSQAHTPDKEIIRMVEQINRAPVMLRRHTRLSLDTSIGRMIIKIIDTETDTVIREVPSSTLQKMYRNIREHLDNFDLLDKNVDV